MQIMVSMWELRRTGRPPRIQKSALRGIFHIIVLLTGTATALGIAGCTLFPEQKSPTLAQTTSAEQNERIFWQMVRKQQWTKLEPLLAANVVWTLPGKTLTRDQIVPYLQGLSITDYTMTDATVKPNGPDMTVSYTLQLSAGSGAPKTISVVSVWQQVKGGWIMTLRSEQPQG
jgi:hypothetical protein